MFGEIDHRVALWPGLGLLLSLCRAGAPVTLISSSMRVWYSIGLTRTHRRNQDQPLSFMYLRMARWTTSSIALPVVTCSAVRRSGYTYLLVQTAGG